MTPTIINLYFASPGDLTEERRLLPDILRQINDSKAREMNVAFKAEGLEEVRPEPLGLREAARIVNCDLFVLILWKRWSEHSIYLGSSIEDKFNTAAAAFKENKRPQLLLYFRTVVPSMMADPGAQLEQVIHFRNRIDEEKANRFALYDQPNQWKDLLLLHLNQWLEEYSRGGDYSGQPEDKQILAPSLIDVLRWRLHEELVSLSPKSSQKAREDSLRYALDALNLVTEGRITLAEAGFAKSLEIHEHPGVLHSFGLFCHQLGSLDRAEAIFMRLLTKSLSEGKAGLLYQSQALISLGLVYATKVAKGGALATESEPFERLMFERYGAAQSPQWTDFRRSFVRLLYVASRSTLAHGLATAFRSKYTDPFGLMVSRLYQHSQPQPQIKVLGTLISTIGGPSKISTLAKHSGEFYELDRLIRERQITEHFVPNISPEIVQELASQAEHRNPVTVDKISRVYSAYPEAIRHLDSKPLAIALSSIVEREVEDPKKHFLVNYILGSTGKASGSSLRSAMQTQVLGGGIFGLAVKSTAAPFTEDSNPIDEPPRHLFANSWFEDEMKNMLPALSPLITGKSYRYLFSIETKKRQGTGRFDPFLEPHELKRTEKSKVQLEIVCPLLDMRGRRGITRRTVEYYSGKGIGSQPFALVPLTSGDYSLTVRVFYIRRLLYRAILPITVVDNSGTTALIRATDNPSYSPSAILR